jgi:hypothetical protein
MEESQNSSKPIIVNGKAHHMLLVFTNFLIYESTKKVHDIHILHFVLLQGKFSIEIKIDKKWRYK